LCYKHIIYLILCSCVCLCIWYYIYTCLLRNFSFSFQGAIVQNMMKFPFPFLSEIYTHLRWDVCFVSYTTKGYCVEKFGLRERKLSAVFSILLIFGSLFKAWWTVNSQKWYLFLYFYLLWYNNIYIYINGNTHILLLVFL
jgi:hypothetical protein